MSSSKEKLKRVGVCAHTAGYKRRNSGASIYLSIPRHAGHGCRQFGRVASKQAVGNWN